jgi:hypothetical protein
MYQNSIQDLPKLRNDDYANILNVHIDDSNRYYYNLLQTITIPDNLPESFYSFYTVGYGDTWPLISYKAYNTPNLWWLITLVNKITNPVIQPSQGIQIKFLIPRYASLVISQLITSENL